MLILAQQATQVVRSQSPNFLLLSAVLLVGTFVSAFILLVAVRRLYHRAVADVAYVRTGFGGRRVVLNGGTLAIPSLHEIVPVALHTMSFDMSLGSDAGLRTSDRTPVQMTVRFIVHVPPNVEAVAQAARSFGMNATDPEQMLPVVRDKLHACVLVVVAATSADDLLEARADFASRLKLAATATLEANGLEAESVLVTELTLAGHSPVAAAV